MKYKVVVGLEMHCELKSNSKVFSSAENSYNELANANVRPVDMAFPGTLPVVNKECVRKALLMSMVLNCKQPEYMYFDRKNYYYPDLPKGFQITQMHDPVGVDGNIIIECDDYEKNVLIHDIHLEEDAASLDHYYDTSLIDYNRAGVPLLELVTEPCLSSAEEAVAFLETMRRIYQYCGVSEADTKKGQIRCDVNVSIMDPDATELGTKVETNDIISIDGVIINKDVKHEYYLLNKPRQVISSVTDKEGRITVTDLINTDARIYPVGRLDYDTTGLIILTNDGDFANMLMHPSYEVEKTYVAKLNKILDKDDINKLKKGIVIDNRKVEIKRFKVRKKDNEKNTSIIELTIVEGRNHIVKRIFESMHIDVMKLSRVGYAFLTLDGLKSGEYRQLSIKEIKKLYALKKC